MEGWKEEEEDFTVQSGGWVGRERKGRGLQQSWLTIISAIVSDVKKLCWTELRALSPAVVTGQLRFGNCEFVKYWKELGNCPLVN